MNRVLISAFEPYESWRANASWLTLVELTRDLPSRPHVTTRLYPVDYQGVVERLRADLTEDYDLLLMTGQAPGRTRIDLEMIALNAAQQAGYDGRFDVDIPHEPLVHDGPLAYRTCLPLAELAETIRAAGIPAGVSYHAGTYLCNAIFITPCT